MKVIKKMFKIIGIILLILFLLIVVLLVIGAYKSNQPLVAKDYSSKVETGGEIEAKYLANGAYDSIKTKEIKTDKSYGKFVIYYPEKLEEKERFPVVIISNGSGTKVTRISESVKHLCTWGFVVIGTLEQSDWAGTSANDCLELLIKLNENKNINEWDNQPLYQKLDLENIGILGHSQGGVGCINAVTTTEKGSMIKTIVAESPTNMELAEKLNWHYDPSKVNVPTLLLAGTGKAETEIVVNEEQLKAIYNTLPDSIEKVMARRTGADHDRTNQDMDGYVTAWFMWELQGDEEAAGAFIGNKSELQNNPLYQNFQKNE
ncbi:lipase [Lachnospiraceae bacterium TWA4]|nr:lipase [Lachnospiraceae bacterium TWA4]